MLRAPARLAETNVTPGLRRPHDRRDNFGPTPIDVAELERIVNGGAHRELFETLKSGAWLGIKIDTICSIDQQPPLEPRRTSTCEAV